MQAGTRSQLQLVAVFSKQAAAVCSKQAATVCSKQAATKSEKSNLHTKNAQAARLQQPMSRKVAATKSRKVAATKSRKVAATKSSKTKNSQAATMQQLAAAAKPHTCCLFAAIHCDKPFISIRAAARSAYSKRKFFLFVTWLTLFYLIRNSNNDILSHAMTNPMVWTVHPPPCFKGKYQKAGELILYMLKSFDFFKN